MRMLYSVLLLFMVATACSPDPKGGLFDDESQDGGSDDGVNQNENYSVAGLKDLYIAGSHSIGVVAIVEGIITANDVMGEFPNRLVIEDESGAIQISGYFDDILMSCKIGSMLTLDCTDLWLGSSGGTLILGAEPTRDDVVDPISASDFVRRATLGESAAQPIPATLTIPQLSQRYISCFVRLDGVRFVEADGIETFCRYDVESGRYLSTTHTLVDRDGNSVELFVPSSVYYGEDPLPSGEGAIFAILEYFSGRYSLRIVYGMFLF